MVASFEALLGRMREYSQDTRKLGQSVEEIYTDSRALDHIAERSSLLALNVSIEANRSDGKAHGVDVVAREIQLLSEKTIDFTQRIRAVIGRVVEESHTLIQRLEDEEEQLLRGWSEQSQEALQALESMRDSTSALTGEVATIARLNRQQTHFAGRVRRHLKETRRLIQNIVGQVSRTNERIGSIHRLFERLDGELERLHIGADERVDEDGVDRLAEVHSTPRSLQVS